MVLSIRPLPRRWLTLFLSKFVVARPTSTSLIYPSEHSTSWAHLSPCRAMLCCAPSSLLCSLLAPAAPTPLTDQYMSPAWPKGGVPWVPGSQPQSQPQASGSLTATATAATTSPHRRRRRRRRNDEDRTKGGPPTSSSRRRNAGTGAGTGTGHRIGSKSTTDGAGLGMGIAQDEPDFHARFACGVPGCGHRFSEARLLALHLRMGHNGFDLEKMKAAREGTEQTYTLDGVSITAPIDVGGHVRLSGGGIRRRKRPTAARRRACSWLQAVPTFFFLKTPDTCR